MEFLTAAQARAISNRDKDLAIAKTKEYVMKCIRHSANDQRNGIVLETFTSPYCYDIIDWLIQLGYKVTRYEATGIKITW